MNWLEGGVSYERAGSSNKTTPCLDQVYPSQHHCELREVPGSQGARFQLYGQGARYASWSFSS